LERFRVILPHVLQNNRVNAGFCGQYPKAFITSQNNKFMNRKAFTKKLALLGACPLIINELFGSEISPRKLVEDDDLKTVRSQKQFVENWLADLLDSMDRNLSREVQEKVHAQYA